MMYVFWWSGRGYLTPIIVLATLSAFGVILQATRPIIADQPWFWGLAFLVAASLNWHFGRRTNRKKLLSIRSKRVRDRLFYRARNRFMSLPMETFSLVIAIFGVAVIGWGTLQPH